MDGGESQFSFSSSTLTTANPSTVLPSKTAAFVPCQAALAVPSSAPCRSSVKAHMWRLRPTPRRWKCRRQCHSFVTWLECIACKLLLNYFEHACATLCMCVWWIMHSMIVHGRFQSSFKDRSSMYNFTEYVVRFMPGSAKQMHIQTDG